MPAVTLSVVVPIFNEVATVRELHARLTAAVSPLGAYELLFVDDGSSDGSWQLLTDLAAGDSHVRLVRLSRNFGHQVALTAGIDAARGDAIVMIDGDLQDPPEVIPELVARWRDGYDVVYGVRTAREGETRYKRWTARLFYRLIQAMSPVEIAQEAGDFRLLSRRAADAHGGKGPPRERVWCTSPLAIARRDGVYWKARER
ncbi:MAG: glycosyltransferase family 2 protein [Actinomycetota bacterium]|nr:glycosyltransferase family 2 protein [Actinomycetota bacterium]